jgi:integrase
LTDKALAITKRLMAQHPTGPLFLNSDGLPWNAYSVNCRFQRLRVAIGRQRIAGTGVLPPKLKRLSAKERLNRNCRDVHHAAVLARRRQIAALAREQCPKYSLYAIRHSWCTHALECGKLDAVTVSVLMGHKDTTMISRVYAHLSQNPSRLRDAARRAKDGPAADAV